MDQDFTRGKIGLTVRVIDNNINGAITKLKKLVQQEGLNHEIKRRRYFEKPTTRRRREQAEAKSRWLKKKSKLDLW